ncbi:MAG: pyruvate formate lyase family protein [Candidatus Latescibacterota bacterium]
MTTTAPPTSTTPRVARLRTRMDRDEHGAQRVPRPADWSVAGLECSLAERRAWALHLACQRMPIAIGPEEVIVGTRTLLPPEGVQGSLWQTPLPAFFRDEAERQSVDAGRSASHNVPGFGKVLRHGLGGLAARARAGLGAHPEPRQQEYLRSFAIACEAAGVLLRRHAELAEELAAQTEDAPWRTELRRIVEVCAHVATGPPRDLQEALQLYWTTWSLIVLEVGCLVSMGRIDQVLAPYWPTAAGEQEHAQELIDCFVVKCNDQNALWSGTSLINNQPVLSGRARTGVDGTNPVTWAVLSAVERLNMPDPQPAVRLHDESPASLVEQVCRLWLGGRAQIAVYNDEVFVPALQGAGIGPADARDYAVDACQDVTIEGKSDFYLAGQVPLANLLLEALGAAPEGCDWDTFLGVYRRLVAAEVEGVCRRYGEGLRGRPGLPCPLLSVTLDDCLETGLDMADGGLAIRDKGVMLAQPVVMINSLAALRQVVFEDGTATLEEVCRGCAADWAGHEHLRRRLLAAPKWGNDDDAADLPGVEVLRFAAAQIQQHRQPDGSRFLSGIHQAHHVAVGSGLGATPDGRHAGQALSPTLAPANGTERGGPTAVMRSVAKIDPAVVQWNASLTLVFSPAGLRGEAGSGKFAALLRAFLRLRGPQLQVNVVSRETLRAAQVDPDQYRDLIVRVWGFSDRFVSLRPEYQEELIQRTQHEV